VRGTPIVTIFSHSKLLFGVILLLTASTAMAGVNNWTPIGPPTDPEIAALAIDPVVSSVFYAPPWRSVDGGATWELTALSSYATDFLFIAAAAGPSGTAYAGTGCCLPNTPSVGLLLKSTDAGLNWTQISSLPGCAILQILVDPLVPNTVFAETECIGFEPYIHSQTFNLIKSLDGGQTWTQIGREIPQQAEILTKLVMDPTDDQILYVGTSVGLFKSADGGSTWSLLSADRFAAVVVARSNPMTIYARVGELISRSTDGGRTFVPTSLNTYYAGRVTELAINPKDPSKLYAAVQGGKYDTAAVFETDSGGTCWKRMAASAGTVDGLFVSIKLAIDPAGKFLLAVTNQRIRVSEYEIAPAFAPICASRPRSEPRSVLPRR